MQAPLVIFALKAIFARLVLPIFTFCRSSLFVIFAVPLFSVLARYFSPLFSCSFSRPYLTKKPLIKSKHY